MKIGDEAASIAGFLKGKGISAVVEVAQNGDIEEIHVSADCQPCIGQELLIEMMFDLGITHLVVMEYAPVNKPCVLVNP